MIYENSDRNLSWTYSCQTLELCCSWSACYSQYGVCPSLMIDTKSCFGCLFAHGNHLLGLCWTLGFRRRGPGRMFCSDHSGLTAVNSRFLTLCCDERGLAIGRNFLLLTVLILASCKNSSYCHNRTGWRHFSSLTFYSQLFRHLKLRQNE